MAQSLNEILQRISSMPEAEQTLMLKWLNSLLLEKERLGDLFAKIQPEEELKRLADKVLALKNYQELRDIAEECVRSYAGEGLNGNSWFTKNDDGSVMAIVSVFFVNEKHGAGSGLMVRIAKEHIIIDEDRNNKELVDMLLQYGVPREQIILAYADETVEETA